MKYKPFDKNYIPGSMSFAMGFLGPQGDVGYQMVLDRVKAKNIVKSLLEEGRDIEKAEIGLDGDWRENSEILYVEGKFNKKPEWPMYNESGWAEPTLLVYFNDGPSLAYRVFKRKNRK